MTTNPAELFARAARQYPQRVALSSALGNLTYHQLDQWSDAIAEDLLASGDVGGKPVMLLSSSRPAAIAAMIATMKVGVVVVPSDAEQGAARLSASVSIAEPAALLCDEEGAATAQGITRISDLRRVPIGPPRAPRATRSTQGPDGADVPAYIYFTSGSTGEPKGILGRQIGVTHFARWEARAFGLTEDMRCSQLTTPAFDAILRDIYTPLLIGGTICVPPERNLIADGERLAAWLDRESVSLVHSIPSVLRLLVHAVKASGRRPSRLKRICVAGESLLPVDVETFFEAFGHDVELINFYGPSETTMVKLFHRVVPGDAARSVVPIGKPIDGARVLVLDSRERPCGVGMIGEIYIRTPFMSLGYYQRPDLTRDAFVANPMSDDPSDLVYRTGDLGRMLDDGTLEFFGRRDRQIKINGVRIELAEVENLLRRHRSVRDVSVVEHTPRGGARELAAYAVLSPEVSKEELHRFLSELAPPAMIPRQIKYVPVLPRTVTGKIDYQALPDLDAESEMVEYTAPTTPIEKTLVAIWSELIQIDMPSTTANFFSVGGHSLLAMQVLSHVEAAFAINVPLNDFILEPTIKGLAAKIEEQIIAASADDDLLKLLDQS